MAAGASREAGGVPGSMEAADGTQQEEEVEVGLSGGGGKSPAGCDHCKMPLHGNRRGRDFLSFGTAES